MPRRAARQIKTIDTLNINNQSRATVAHYYLQITTDSLSRPISMPVMIARGLTDGPILGVTAAVHGDELNGISVIQRLFNEIEVNELTGTIVGVPVVNVPSYIRKQRRFNDGVDLNHIFPGNPNGNLSQVYAHRVLDRLISHMDFLLDLHTASLGRINSYYVRADMNQPVVKKLARLQNADIIVHNPPSDGTLRGAAAELGIPAITLEVGNPNTFQKSLIRSGVDGIHNVLSYLQMTDDELIAPKQETVICKRSIWIYSDHGGLLTIPVELREKIKEGSKIAHLKDIFGVEIKDYYTPHDGIVIGKSVNPAQETGGRILHLGLYN